MVTSLGSSKVALLPNFDRFTPVLIDLYNEFADEGDFEIVFISADKDEESFNGYFSKMPWLAVPFSDTKTREALDGCFKISEIPHIVSLDESGKVLTDTVMLIGEHVKDFKARENQSLRTILESPSRNYIITANGDKVNVTNLQGKTVGLYVMLSTYKYKDPSDFTGTLVKVYNELKAKDENFEIVMIPLDDNEESFNKEFSGLPWLSLPFKDKKCEKLVRYFELSTLPTLVVIGLDGKTLHPNVADALEEHGVIAYPFTPDKFAELEKIEKAKQEAQTLESVLVSRDLNFVLGKDGAKVCY
ncbi:probable nucleoredoxin 1 [Tanacetum coccineum]